MLPTEDSAVVLTPCMCKMAKNKNQIDDSRDRKMVNLVGRGKGKGEIEIYANV